MAQGTKAELLQTAGTYVRSANQVELALAMTRSGVDSTPSVDGGLRTDAEPSLVGKIAHAADVPLLELRSADGAGLEEMFLELTSDTQREGVVS
ncbi:MAG: hypothetical protein ABI873_15020 [Marmoricola sp.]